MDSFSLDKARDRPVKASTAVPLHPLPQFAMVMRVIVDVTYDGRGDQAVDAT
jgi:hypothetical protein